MTTILQETHSGPARESHIEQMLTDEIRQKLVEDRDEPNAVFMRKLIPNVAPETILGLRTPYLRSYAKQLAKREDIDTFLADLPHAYFDENLLHAFVISGIKDFDACLAATERFLPYVDNWAVCDQLSPVAFGKHYRQLLPAVRRWLRLKREYTIRYGIGTLMRHFLDEDFRPQYLEMVARIHSDRYYIQMMQAWYFATALVKQYDAACPFIEQQRLDKWTHNKTIQKAVESLRITDEQKAYLRTLKVT